MIGHLFTNRKQAKAKDRKYQRYQRTLVQKDGCLVKAFGFFMQKFMEPCAKG